jgi:hypothetical protein
MLSLPEEVELLDVRSGTSVKAYLVKLTRELAASKIDGEWWNIPVPKSKREKEGDHHWKWRKLVGEIRNDTNWESLAVQSAGGAIEGAITYRIDAISHLDPGQGAVFIDRLASAPRSRPWLVGDPQYKGSGSVLALRVVRHSYELGLGGRVWLFSLPTDLTRAFYVRRGFRELFSGTDGTIAYELPASEAERWLRLKGFF